MKTSYFNEIDTEELIHKIQNLVTNKTFISKEDLILICSIVINKRDLNLLRHTARLIKVNQDFFFSSCYEEFMLSHYKTYSIDFDIISLDILLNENDFFQVICEEFGVYLITMVLPYLSSDKELVRVLTVRMLTYLMTSSVIDEIFVEKIIKCLVVCSTRFDETNLKKEVVRFSVYCTDDKLNKIIDFYLENETDYLLKLLCTVSVTSRNRIVTKSTENLDRLKVLLGVR